MNWRKYIIDWNCKIWQFWRIAGNQSEADQSRKHCKQLKWCRKQLKWVFLGWRMCTYRVHFAADTFPCSHWHMGGGTARGGRAAILCYSCLEWLWKERTPLHVAARLPPRLKPPPPLATPLHVGLNIPLLAALPCAFWVNECNVNADATKGGAVGQYFR